jgi:serine protease Do
MKQYFFKISGMVVMVLLIQFMAYSQDESDSIRHKEGKMKDNDEIIIKSKGGKDSKLTIEIRNGQVTVNGKSIDDFDDDGVSVRKRRNDFEDFGNIKMFAPEVAKSPFRGGGWNYSGDDENPIKLLYGTESKTAFLGVITESADNGGSEITEVTKGSAADKTGLKQGDVILRIGDTKVDSQEDIVKAIHQHKPMDKVVVKFKRNGKDQELTVTLGRSNSTNLRSFNYSIPKMEELGDMPYAYSFNSVSRPRLGIKAQDTEDGKGVKVLDVDDDSPADKAGVKEGDIITEFEGKEVNSAETLATISRDSRTKYDLKLKLIRDGKAQDVEIKMPRKLKTADL